jgi:hypothetical protein
VGVTVIVALIGALAFMLRHYFLRVERLLKRSFELFDALGNHELRIERLEVKAFGESFSGRGLRLHVRGEGGSRDEGAD